MVKKRQHPDYQLPIAAARATFANMLLLALWLTGLPGLLHALESDRQQPIRLQAESTQINEHTGVATYTGTVSFRQGSLRILAHRVLVRRDRDGLRTVTAHGEPVTIRQQVDGPAGEVVIQGRWARYQARSRTMLVKDGVAVRLGKDTIHTTRLRYELDTDRVIAGGDADGTRVTAIIHPRTSGPNADPARESNPDTPVREVP